MKYSINYISSSSYDRYAVDWNWQFRNRWARSYTEGVGTTWTAKEGLDIEAYRAILDEFQLAPWADEYEELQIKNIEYVSPIRLLAIRREIEKRFPELPPLQLELESVDPFCNN